MIYMGKIKKNVLNTASWDSWESISWPRDSLLTAGPFDEIQVQMSPAAAAQVQVAIPAQLRTLSHRELRRRKFREIPKVDIVCDCTRANQQGRTSASLQRGQ
jgi:hypothetical protein